MLGKLTLLALAALISFSSAESIFDGKTLDGWRIQDAAYWTVKDGILIGESDEKKRNSILWTEKDYTDFVFQTDFRYHSKIDSGIFLRHEVDQIQIGISGSLKRDMTGSPYISSKRKYPVEAEGVAELLKEGEWNTMKITVKGADYTIELNGEKILEYTSKTSIEKGPVGFQVHSGMLMKIEFRNITLSSL